MLIVRWSGAGQKLWWLPLLGRFIQKGYAAQHPAFHHQLSAIEAEKQDCMSQSSIGLAFPLVEITLISCNFQWFFYFLPPQVGRSKLCASGI